MNEWVVLYVTLHRASNIIESPWKEPLLDANTRGQMAVWCATLQPCCLLVVVYHQLALLVTRRPNKYIWTWSLPRSRAPAQQTPIAEIIANSLVKIFFLFFFFLICCFYFFFFFKLYDRFKNLLFTKIVCFSFTFIVLHIWIICVKNGMNYSVFILFSRKK